MNTINFAAIPVPGFFEPVSSWTHLLAATLSFVGFFILLKRAKGNGVRVFSIVIYTMSLIFLFSMSGVYHLLDRGTIARDVFQRLDHAGIWFLIAGTFTPIHTILFRGPWRWGVLLTVWIIAITGLTLEVIFFSSIPEWLYMCFYLGLGWFGLISMWKFRVQFSHKTLSFMVAGGLFYSIGALFEFIRWPIFYYGVVGPHEIFHIFVMLGALSHWLFIYTWSNQPVYPKIEVHVKVYPNNQYYAFGINEKIMATGKSADQLKENLKNFVDQQYHTSIKPQIELKYFNQEIL